MNEMLAYLHENDKQADVNSAAYDAYYKMFTITMRRIISRT